MRGMRAQRWRRGQGACAVALALSCSLFAPAVGVAQPAREPDRSDVAETTKTLVDTKSYQTELPVNETPPPPEPRRSGGDGWRIGGVGDGVFYALLAAAALLVLIALAPILREAIGWRFPAAKARAVTRREDEVEAEPIAPRTLEGLAAIEANAGALVEAGRVAEAIHLLLIEALLVFGARDARAVARALTSREIVGRVRAKGWAAAALGVLVAAVEISRFGGRAPSRADYERCLAAFRELWTRHGPNAVAAAAAPVAA